MIFDALGSLPLAETDSSETPTVYPSAISSAEAFGSPYINTLFPTAIAGAEAFGTPSVAVVLSPSGIASAMAFGTLAFPHNATGIPSAEAFGTPSLGEYQALLPMSRL